MDRRTELMTIITNMMQADPHAMTELFNMRVKCNKKLKEMSGVNARTIVENGSEKYYIGIIGLINAILHSININKIAIHGIPKEDLSGLLLAQSCLPYEVFFSPQELDDQ